MLQVEVRDDEIRFGDALTVGFERTLRVPDDGKTYSLPPGLGVFPVFRVEDYAKRVPAAWREHGGVFIPMYQREALWICFSGRWWKPSAVKVGIGKINAVSGQPWDEGLCDDPQDYVVCPHQPWLDGINAGEGYIKQFVAMPLGEGYTIEGQLTGKEEFGGVQLIVFEPKPGRFPDEPPKLPAIYGEHYDGLRLCRPAPMGLAAGGRIRQKIYPDPYGADTWDLTNSGRVWVHIVNNEMFRQITGREPPPTPISARDYTAFGLPWFELYDEDKGDLDAAGKLKSIKSVKQTDQAKYGAGLQDDDPVEVPADQTIHLGEKPSKPVQNGNW